MTDGGRWVLLAADEEFVCRCGARKDGAKRGPRGGHQWLWSIGLDRFCGPKCPAKDEAELERAMDDQRGEWEAEQAMERHDEEAEGCT